MLILSLMVLAWTGKICKGVFIFVFVEEGGYLLVSE